MKKLKYIFIFLALSSVLTSCYDDKGNYDYTELSGIEVEGLDDTYSRVAYDENLHISPTIISDYNESDLEFIWIKFNAEDKPDTIWWGKNIDYPVTEAVGIYQMWFTVRVKNTENPSYGYFRHFRFKLSVETKYSKGHYILKETASGDTELDLLLPDDEVVRDILTDKLNGPMEGAPRSMGILYGRQMIDPETNSKSYAHSLGIITYANKLNILRASDMYLAFDNSNLFYQPPADYKLYKLMTCVGNVLFSDLGVYRTDTNVPGSGYLGFASEPAGGSDHYAFSSGFASCLYWDETNKRMLYTHHRGTVGIVATSDPAVQMTDMPYECVFMGAHRGTVYALLREDNGGKLWLFEFAALDYSLTPEFTKRTEVPAGSKLYGATHLSTNDRDVKFIYFVNDNKLYYYDIVSGDEYDMTAQGLPADAEITFMANRNFSLEQPRFNYITVATYKDGNYDIYMYDMLGGLPFGEPVRSVSGTGRVKETHYLGLTFDGSMVTTAANYEDEHGINYYYSK